MPERLLNIDLERGLCMYPYAKGHGASKDSLGLALVYYLIPYALKSNLCVCLGSGAGFVPSLMRQAQRDLNLLGSRTILVDGVLPEVGFGGPDFAGGWMDENSPFNKDYPEVNVVYATTENAPKSFFSKIQQKIDYLHIDADHSTSGVMRDLKFFWPHLSASSVITFHDYATNDVRAALEQVLRDNSQLESIGFPNIGAGLAILKRK